MLGQDVKYSNNSEDSQLLIIAKEEKRILLTRDFQLYQRAVGKGLEAFYLEGRTGEEKLAEVAERFHIGLDIDMASSRCPKCNSTVKPVSPEKAAKKVEESTLKHYQEFWKCPKCGQIYWQGAHWTKIRKTLNAAKEILNEKEKEN